jgi:hypothetical protein
MIKYNTAVCRSGKIDSNYIFGHVSPTILPYQHTDVLYVIITLAGTTCKIPEDGVLTTQHVGVILTI